jgi:hypothetical protein
MRRLLLPIAAFAVLAQQPAEESKPAPAAEQRLSGTVEFGYRVLSGVGGDFQTYRSVVNLGEGPKLFSLDASWDDPKGRLFDKLDLRMNSWGGDPYNTARFEAGRARAWRFTADYRNIQYFNFLPSFADPTIERGVLLNQRALDSYRRATDLELAALPGRRITPYAAYSRNSSRGHGITTFVLNANEYPVPHMLRDHSDNVRGGVRLEWPRWQLHLEGGGITWHIDQQVYTFPERNFGNVLQPVLGQTLFLDRGNQSLDVRGSSRFARGSFRLHPADWAELAGQFQFSQPDSKTRYAQNNSGNFVNFTLLRFYSAELVSAEARARQPHTSASFAAELRPLQRVRIVESWMTDRLHDAGAALLTDRLLAGEQLLDARTASAAERLVLNYNQQEISLMVDVARGFTLRGGHRYVWGDAETPAPLILLPGAQPKPELRRHVALACGSLVAGRRLRVTADLEASPGDRSYFRTSLHRYQRGKVRARYQILPSLLVSANFHVLNNQNPTAGIGYDFLSRQNSLGLQWTPGGGKWISLLGEYTRYTLRSDLTWRDPATLRSELSKYRDNGHAGTGWLEVGLPGRGSVQPRIHLGGSLVAASGTRPARFYQPFGRLAVPFGRRGQWYGEWRWHALTQPFYLYEGFRNHQFVTGLRLTM